MDQMGVDLKNRTHIETNLIADLSVAFNIIIVAAACCLLPIAPACRTGRDCPLPIAVQMAEAAQILNGSLADIHGDVKIQRSGSSIASPARSGSRVEPGDAVITGQSGRAAIKFEHGQIDLDNATRLTLLRCMSSHDESFAELALSDGAVTALINMERGKEFWFDIITPTKSARGRGNKKGVAHLAVSHRSGTTVTDSEVGQWQYQPIMLPDQPPAVQAALTNNAKASVLLKDYIGTTLNQNTLGAYEVRRAAGEPDIGLFAPSNTAAPVISGTAKIGGKLTCSPGKWIGNLPPTFKFQWLRDGKEISGATDESYTVVEDDGLHKISCKVTGTNETGESSATSNEVGVEVEKPKPAEPETPPAPAPAVVPPLSLTITLQEGKGAMMSSSSTATSAETK